LVRSLAARIALLKVVGATAFGGFSAFGLRISRFPRF
jgi:hypothetical protein